MSTLDIEEGQTWQTKGGHVVRVVRPVPDTEPKRFVMRAQHGSGRKFNYTVDCEGVAQDTGEDHGWDLVNFLAGPMLDMSTLEGICTFLTTVCGMADEAEAMNIAKEFADKTGLVPYFNNPGQKKYGGPAITVALMRAAQAAQGGNLPVAGYERLAKVLQGAYDQAARTKGAERHANAKPFHEQPMQTIAERRGIGFLLGQVDKKTEEAQGMVRRGDYRAAIRELEGAINYIAGTIIAIQDGRGL